MSYFTSVHKQFEPLHCILYNVSDVSIPLKHLSDFESLREKALETLTPGATVDAVLFCFDRDLHPVFSLRASAKHHFQVKSIFGSFFHFNAHYQNSATGLQQAVILNTQNDVLIPANPVLLLRAGWWFNVVSERICRLQAWRSHAGYSIRGSWRRLLCICTGASV